ncbi:MAG: AsmA family protein [Alphaproteobacteria bacterium]|nr:AsmA family protein [Alphaproteobacteria bacterium]
MRWAASIVGFLAIVIIGVVVFVATLDVDAYKGDIQSLVKQKTGRELVITGPLALSWTPRPSLTASEVTLTNASWGSEPTMVSVGELAVGVEFMPLLSGQLDIDNLRLADVTVLLERDAGGVGNWETGATGGGRSEGGGDEALPFIRSLDLSNITVVWKDGPTVEAKRYAIAHLAVSADSVSAPMVIDLDVDLDGDLVTLKGTLPAVAEALRPGATLPVDLTGSLAGTALKLAANIQVERNVKGIPSMIRADRVVAGWGELAVSGRAHVNMTGLRPRIDAEVSSDRLDLAALSGGDGASPASGGTTAGDPLDTPVPLDFLGIVDGRIVITVRRLIADRLEASDVAVTVTLADGVATVDPMSAVVSGGTVTATAMADGAARPARLASTGRWTDVNFGDLARALGRGGIMEGQGETVWNLNGTGDTPRALLGSSTGDAWVVIKSGEIKNDYWEMIAEDLTTQFLPFLNSSDRGSLNCIVGRWDLTNGIADTTVLLVDSSRAIVAGAGTIDLARQTLDMRLVPQPKDASLISLATPILLKGPIEDPTVAPDPFALAKDVGTVVAGSMLGPVGLLLPFLSTGSGDNLCSEAIAVAEGRKPKGSFTGADSNNPVDTVTGAGVGVTKGVAKGVKGAAEGVATGVKGLFDTLRKAVE